MLLYTSLIISLISFSHSFPQGSTGQPEPNPWKDGFPRVLYQTCLAEVKENSTFASDLRLWEGKTKCERAASKELESRVCVCYAISNKNCKDKNMPKEKKSEFNCDSLPKRGKRDPSNVGDRRQQPIRRTTIPGVTRAMPRWTRRSQNLTSRPLVTQPVPLPNNLTLDLASRNPVPQSRNRGQNPPSPTVRKPILLPVATTPVSQSTNRNFTSRLLFTISPKAETIVTKPVVQPRLTSALVTKPTSQSVSRSYSSPSSKSYFTSKPAVTRPVSQSTIRGYTFPSTKVSLQPVTSKLVVTRPTMKSTARGQSFMSTQKQGQMGSTTAFPQHILDSILMYDEVQSIESNQAAEKKRKMTTRKNSSRSELNTSRN